MIRRRRMLAARVHLPLRLLALCLDCDECFEISSQTCPACGSATRTSLARFLEQASSARHPGHRDAVGKRHDDPPEMVRQLIIVAVDRAHLYEHLKRGFAGNETVRVLLNRRVIARRARSGPYEAERRQADRRLPSKVDALLRAIGWAIVPLDLPKHHHRDSALQSPKPSDGSEDRPSSPQGVDGNRE